MENSFLINQHRSGRVYTQPHFFVLCKGNNSGKPLSVACPNCFVLLFSNEQEKESLFWLCWGLWQAKAFYPLLIGSVIPFIRIGEFQRFLLKVVSSDANHPQAVQSFTSSMQQLKALEHHYKESLLLVAEAKRALFGKLLHR